MLRLKINLHKIYIKLLLPILLVGKSSISFAQQSNNKLNISGFAELYYQYGFNNPGANSRPNFIYSHHRNNEVNINLAFIKANYETDRLRTNLALATGTYMNANYAEEQGVLKNLYEANVGFKVSKSKNIWIDAGLFPSHIGFESAIGKDNWTLTRSIAAENSPYFETGAKITYISDNEKWLLSGLILNGWQRIQRLDGNSTLAFGHQLTYTPSAKLTLNSSSFIGNDKPDTVKQMRYFHNLYAIYQVNNKLALRAGFDIGAEQKVKNSLNYNIWYTPVMIAKLSFTNKYSMAVRAEYYQDRHGVKIATATQNGFKTFGYSINADYQLLPNLVWRTELRNLDSKDNIFINRNATLKQQSLTAVTAIAVNF